MSEYLLLQISTWTQVAAFLLTVIDRFFQARRSPTMTQGTANGRSFFRLMRENGAMISAGIILIIWGAYFTYVARPSEMANGTPTTATPGPCNTHIDGVALAATLRGYLNNGKANQPREVSIVVETGNLTFKYAKGLRTAFVDAGWNPLSLKEIDREHLQGDAVWFQAPANDILALQLFQYLESSQPIYFVTPQPANGGRGWVFWIKDTWPSWVPRAGGS